MPSKDPINSKANEWMAQAGHSVPVRLSETDSQAPGRTGSRTERRDMSAQVQRLARRRGIDPDELAVRIPPDTLRRTKYPVLEQVTEDGKRIFKHDTGIENDGRTALIRQ